MKQLNIEFRANHLNCDYNWKLDSKCKTIEHLKTMKLAIDTYMDMKIKEAVKESEEK